MRHAEHIYEKKKGGDFIVADKTLNYSFYNPNTVEDTADFLLKLFVEVNRPKVDAAIRKAAETAPELENFLPSESSNQVEAIV